MDNRTPTLKEIFDGYMAAYAGFEPTNAGVKFLCLTVWRIGYIFAGFKGNRHSLLYGGIIKTFVIVERSRLFSATGDARRIIMQNICCIYLHKKYVIFLLTSYFGTVFLSFFIIF